MKYLAHTYHRRGSAIARSEPCHCGASDCVACRGPGADRSEYCKCAEKCECEPCGEHEAGEECPVECRCECKNGCECEQDDGSDDAYDSQRDRDLEWHND